MDVHLYVSMIPEALIASQLTPAEFGQYYATGSRHRSKGQAIFVELDPQFRDPFFDLDTAFEECVPHPDGRPKNSTYVSTYRVLEHIPVSDMRQLHLTTAYGATLSLDPSSDAPPETAGLHLYKEYAPVNSLVASSATPRAFYDSITTAPSKLVQFPALCFVELDIGELATNPKKGAVGALPYENIPHLRESLMAVDKPGKITKMVERAPTFEFPYRTVKPGSGFFIGNGPDLAFHAMPSVRELRNEHALWWRSANQ